MSVRPELGDVLPGWPVDSAPAPGLGVAVPWLAVEPPTDGVPGVTRGLAVMLGPLVDRWGVPGVVEGAGEAGRLVGAVPGVLGAAEPAPAYPRDMLDEDGVAPPVAPCVVDAPLDGPP